MRVKDLDGALVNGYRSFNVLGIGTEHKRGLLYHDLFSSQAPGFKSENTAIEQALAATEASVQHLDVPKTWVLDRGFDNDAHWWWVWDHTSSHLVWRVKHTGRIVLWCTPQGVWEERYLESTLAYAQPLATIETELEVCLRGQKRAKRQAVTVELAAVPLRVYAPAAAGQKGAQRRTKDVWLVQVAVRNAVSEPWLLLTDWPVTDEAASVRIFRFYRLRWVVEVVFTQMAKPYLFTLCAGGNDIANLDLAVGHDDSVNEQHHQLAFLLKRGMGQTLLHTVTKGINRMCDSSEFTLVLGFATQLLFLVGQRLQLLGQFLASALVFIQRNDRMQVGISQTVDLVLQAQVAFAQVLTPGLEFLRQPVPALGAAEFVAD